MSPRLLFLDPIGGVSGDMLLGALVDLGVPVEAFEAPLRRMGLSGFSITSERKTVGGIDAAKVRVHVDAPQPARTWRDIRTLLEAGDLPEPAGGWALRAFARLARAEAKIHGMSEEDVHFHEVGGVDALVDVCGTALAVAALGVEAVHAAPPPLGRGRVKAAHGWLPVPAPATLEVLRDVPVAASETEGELTTPTGATLLATLAAGRVGPPPALVPRRVGYGAGDAVWPDRPNVLRAVLADPAPGAASGAELAGADLGEVRVVEANVDDLTPELMAVAVERCLAAGAVDALVLPAVMKKGRAGHLLQVLCRPEAESEVVEAVLAHTSTFGLRIQSARRVELPRRFDTVDTPWGAVRVKVARLADRPATASPELEDCRSVAEAAQVPVRAVWAAAVAAWYGAHGP